MPREQTPDDNVKIIFTGPRADAIEAVEFILRDREQFERDANKIGWGWHYRFKSGRDYFLRRIKGGVSAKLVQP